MPLPEFTDTGDLPSGIHEASLEEIIERFGQSTPRRKSVTERLVRIHELVVSTGKLARFIIFGSYVTDKERPNDEDVFLVMHQGFVATRFDYEVQRVFSHPLAESGFGASVFWTSETVPDTMMQQFLDGWQCKREVGYEGLWR